MNKRYPGLTEEKLEEMLAELGVFPRVDEDGIKWSHKDDIEKAWKRLK